MIKTNADQLEQLIIHKVGSKEKTEDFFLADETVNLPDSLVKELLVRFFLYSFKNEEYFQFTHDQDIQLNEVYVYCSHIFENPNSLVENSQHLAKHLLKSSHHPKIKSGEFYVAYFSDIQLEDEVCDAIGLFKSENKETYLKIHQHQSNFAVENDQGININKLDKGCIIYNTEKEHGYKLQIIDHTNHQEAQYWMNGFLQVKLIENDYYHTQNYLQMCRDFALQALPHEDKIDQIDLINNSANYFKENEAFDKVEFQEKVLQKPEIIEAFENYETEYQSEKKMNPNKDFQIAPNAVRKMKKVFKSVIKLDKNFHIYVHGNRELIRKGFDEESGLHFYQLFFNQEE